jgi:hypothetical protein
MGPGLSQLQLEIERFHRDARGHDRCTQLIVKHQTSRRPGRSVRNDSAQIDG